MAAKKKHSARRRNTHFYFRLVMAAVLLVLLSALAGIGWFIWTTISDVANRNDGSTSIKVQGIDTTSLAAMEMRDQERRSNLSALPPIERDPFIMKAGVPGVVPPVVTPVAPPVVTPPATTAASTVPAIETMPTIDSLQ